MPEVVVFGISFGFPELSRCDGQIAHVLLTRSPLVYPRRGLTARLACVKHAASVRPEPGSNSPLNSVDVGLATFIDFLEYPGKSWSRSRAEPSYQRNRPQTSKNQRAGLRSLPTGRFKLIRRLLAHC